ncbi:DUF5041 domain-containing protein [Parabacteroides sp. OttesenSCG-928-G07]|nr:DUF5041 domain-containing protein [Parabacteroides sp. OttesenSCG-928-G21]MDL2278343.1 DUF5041 domain-containing protein [Parabacteroides sp. OttesenSCG-928-G07]
MTDIIYFCEAVIRESVIRTPNVRLSTTNINQKSKFIMLHYSNFDSIMETEIVSKNGLNLEKHTSRVNKLFIIICMLLLPYTAFSQQIKSKNIELEDLLTLLNASGYELFSFDITEMLKERYDITLVSKEYDKGGEIASKNLNLVQNKRLLTDFPESQWQAYIDAGGKFVDSETKTIAHAEKICFGFYPSENDSTVHLQIQIPSLMNARTPITLRGLPMKDSDKKFFSYHTRPFKIGVFEENVFIPLVLYGSMWFDEKYEIFRFCGEREIDSNMSSEILKDVPHYYVFGVVFAKKQ